VLENTFIIGATGFVGGGIARVLAASGKTLTGLARSPTAASRLEAAGVAAIIGDVERNIDAVISAARSHDVIVYAAQVAPPSEFTAVSALLDALAGSEKTFLFLSGSGVLCQRTEGAWSADSFAEDDPFSPEPFALARVETEGLVRAAAGRGLRAMVIRPPTIWGPGDHGHVPMVYQSVAATGAACYVGEGLATYGHVHIDDIADLFARAIDTGEAGALYHGVAGEISNRWIAESVARDLNCDTRSVTMSEAAEIWGEFGALIMSVSSRVRDSVTRKSLGWSPRHTDMLSEIGEARLRALATPNTNISKE
jgi:nucleoside-diphosphate-sugar epimerase